MSCGHEFAAYPIGRAHLRGAAVYPVMGLINVRQDINYVLSFCDEGDYLALDGGVEEVVATEVEGEGCGCHCCQFKPWVGEWHGGEKHDGGYQEGLHGVGGHVFDEAQCGQAGMAHGGDECDSPCKHSGGELAVEEYAQAVDGVVGEGEGHVGEGDDEGYDGCGVAHDFEAHYGCAFSDGEEVVGVE